MMKKFWVISIASIAALSITGGVLAAQSGQFIGKSKAKDAALSIQEGKVTEVDLDYEKGKHVYEVEIVNKDQEIDVKVDAVTGNIEEVDYDDYSQRQQFVQQDTTASPASSTNNQALGKAVAVVKSEQQASGSAAAAVQTDNKQSSSSDNQRLTKEQAIEIALKVVDGKVVDVDLDKDDGVLKYEIEIKNAELEAEIEVDAYSGKVLSKDIDYDDDRDEDDVDDDDRDDSFNDDDNDRNEDRDDD